MDAAAVYQELLKISTTLGTLTAECRATNETIAKHVEDDKAMAADIQELKLGVAAQRGGIKVLAAISTAIGAVFGAVVSIWATVHGKG